MKNLLLLCIIFSLFLVNCNKETSETSKNILDANKKISQKGLARKNKKEKKKKNNFSRTALIIGNAEYNKKGIFSPLKNSINDANEMDRILKKCNFKTTLLLNASFAQMESAASKLGKNLRTNGGTGLFFYSGHGIQQNNVNYLIPVDVQIAKSYDLEANKTALSVQLIRSVMKHAGNLCNLIIVDACREEIPKDFFPKTSKGKQKEQNYSFVPLQPPKGMSIIYATANKSLAWEKENDRLGIFTKHFTRFIPQKGISLSEAFQRTVAAVSEETKDIQIPWREDCFTSPFYFNPAKISNVIDKTQTANYIQPETKEIKVEEKQKELEYLQKKKNKLKKEKEQYEKERKEFQEKKKKLLERHKKLKFIERKITKKEKVVKEIKVSPYAHLNANECSEKLIKIFNYGDYKYYTGKKKLYEKDTFNLTLLPEVGRLIQLEELDLQATEISDTGLQYLKTLVNLKKLNLSINPLLTDKGLSYLQYLKSLEELNLKETAISSEGLKSLQNLTSLKELNLSWATFVTDEGLKYLEKLKSLRKLSLEYTQVTAKGVERLQSKIPFCKIGIKTITANFSNKRAADILSGTKYGIERDEDISEIDKQGIVLQRIKNLRFTTELKIENNFKKYLERKDFTLEELSYLKELTNLKSLMITSFEFDLKDKHLTFLKDLKNLEILELHDSYITGKTLQQIQHLKHLKELSIYNTEINAEDLKYLYNMKSLRDIYFNRGDFSQQSALRKLQSNLPHCDISGLKLTYSVLFYRAMFILIAILIIIFLFFFIRKKRKKKMNSEKRNKNK